MNIPDATLRFSNRAGQYALYRPGYPEAIISFLENSIGLNTAQTIADIGSGTGFFSGLFLEAGYDVKAVEPNDNMRSAAEDNLGMYKGFRSFKGSAEATGLEDHSVDLITVAQAFHWFRPLEAKKEFERILKPSGHILLVWNILQHNTPFLAAYTRLKEKYSEILPFTNRANLERIKEIFYPSPVITHSFSKVQYLNNAGIRGHLSSFSTVPEEGHPVFEQMTDELDMLFHEYKEDGAVRIDYETKTYLIPSV